MRTEVQQAKIDAYEFYFTFPDPHQNISMDVPIASWRWSTVCVHGQLCSAWPAPVSLQCQENLRKATFHLSPAWLKAESPPEKSTKQCLLSSYPRNISES